MVTNGEFFKKLTNEEKLKFREQYGNHPLKDFIDWQQFYDSESGDEMEFVNGIKCKISIDDDDDNTTIITDTNGEIEDDNDDATDEIKDDENEMNCIILSTFIDDESGLEYLLVFCIDDNTFYKIPKPVEEVSLIPKEFGGEEPEPEFVEEDDEFMEFDFMDEPNLDIDDTDSNDDE
jgi:hypothetical protein